MRLLRLEDITIVSKLNYTEYQEDIEEIANSLFMRLLDKRAFVDISKDIKLFIEQKANDLEVSLYDFKRNYEEQQLIESFF